MDYIDCKLKIADLKSKVYEIQDEKEKRIQILNKEVGVDLNNEYSKTIKKILIDNYLKIFEDNGWKEGWFESKNELKEISLPTIIYSECKQICIYTGDTTYNQKLDNIINDMFKNIKRNMQQQLELDKRILQLLYEIQQQYGTMNISNHIKRPVTRGEEILFMVDKYVIRKDDTKEVDIYLNDLNMANDSDKEIINEIARITNTQNVFKENSSNLLSAINELSIDKIKYNVAKDRFKNLDIVYDEKIEVVKEMIQELEEILPDLKEKMLNS